MPWTKKNDRGSKKTAVDGEKHLWEQKNICGSRKTSVERKKNA